MRPLIPFDAYKNPLFELGIDDNPGRLSGALASIEWALRNKPEDFPVVQGQKTLRMVKTDAIRDIPALRCLFTLDDKGQVQVRYIEAVKGDDSENLPLM